MRIVYKALASAGMLALSTVAALGIRHFVKMKSHSQQNDPSESEKDGNHRFLDADKAQPSPDNVQPLPEEGTALKTDRGLDGDG